MKNSNELRNELHRLTRLLQEADIAIYINPVVVQNISKNVDRVTWVSCSDAHGELYFAEPATVDMYCAWLDANAYSAILYDGSILQMSYDFKGENLVKHRLLYFPCPFDVDIELLQYDAILDVISLYIHSEKHQIKLRTPLRFDFDLDAATEEHPAAHLTMLWNHCRWAAVAPFSPGHFLQFVFKNFYPNLWGVHDFLREWPLTLGNRTITSEEEKHLHISCVRESGELSAYDSYRNE